MSDFTSEINTWISETALLKLYETVTEHMSCSLKEVQTVLDIHHDVGQVSDQHSVLSDTQNPGNKIKIEKGDTDRKKEIKQMFVNS